MSKCALVTGASGFIGSHLVKRLTEDGYIVHLVVRESSNTNIVQDIVNSKQIHVCDSKGKGLYDIMSGVLPDVVFHLAAFFRAEHQVEDISKLVESNMEFGMHLLDAMSANNVRCLVNTGTSWQHYDGDEYNPVCLYAATKQSFEAIMDYYRESSGVRSVTLKLTDTYGPNDHRGKLFAFLRRAAVQSTTLILSPGEQLLDLVYIDDVVSAYMIAAHRLLTNDYPKEQFLISSGKQYSLKEVVQIYERVTQSQVDVRWGGRQYRTREVMAPWRNGPILDGWVAKVDLEEGIRRMESII